MIPRHRAVTVAVVAAALSTAAACGSSPSGSDSSHVLTVDAAASLTTTFTQLGKQFEAAHPGTTVRFDFAGSDALAAAITSGAPVDVFAAASTATMATVTKAGEQVGTPQVFVRNSLEIAVPPSNPAHVTSLADTVKPGVRLLLCAATVPCGATAVTAYAAAHLTPHPKSYSLDVESLLTSVELGNADAGLVYTTDVQAAGSKVHGVPFPEASQAVTSYPIVVTKNGKDRSGAQQFVQYVRSAAGQKVLTAAGFLAP